MVWARMGLLDDAIREHLELTRRRGAEPGEVAREQHEALDPVERGPLEASDEGAAFAELAPAELPSARHADDAFDLPEAGVMAGGVPEDVPDELADAPPPVEEAAAGLGETAELDMRTVLGDDAASSGNATPGVAGGVRPAPLAGAPLRSDTPADGDSLEWEMPGEEVEPELDEREPSEDVLEETPDFLRDTPEQERLWFEQRPPRDFDFDK